MPKFYRFTSLFLLLATLWGCSGQQQSDSTPSPISEEKTADPAENKPDITTSEKTPVESLPEPKPTANAEKTTASAKPAEPKKVEKKADTPKPAPQKLPELTKKEKELVSQVSKEVEEETPVSKENTGMVTVNRVLMAQEAMWLLGGSFSTDFRALEPNLPMETDEYKFSIPQGDSAKAVVQAIAKSDKLHSFTGTSVAIPTQVPKSALCRTKLPSQNPPQPPTIKDGQIACSNDGVLVEF